MDQIIQSNTQPNTKSIEEMQQKLAAALGISDLTDERQKELINKATETILQKIFLDTVDRLSEEDRKAYLELIEKESEPEEINKFLNSKIAGYTDIVQKLVDDFVNGMKAAGVGSSIP